MLSLAVIPGLAGSATLKEIRRPPGAPDAVRIRTLAVGICGTDREILAGHYGTAPPGAQQLILGHESLGEVIDAPPACDLVAGDLVVHPVPFTFDGYPKEWAATLDRLAAMDARIIVPGHGEVLRDDTYILQLSDLFRSIVEQVEAELDRDPESSLDVVKSRVDIRELRAAILGDDTVDAGFFDYAMGFFIEFSYHEAKQR